MSANCQIVQGLLRESPIFLIKPQLQHKDLYISIPEMKGKYTLPGGDRVMSLQIWSAWGCVELSLVCAMEHCTAGGGWQVLTGAFDESFVSSICLIPAARVTFDLRRNCILTFHYNQHFCPYQELILSTTVKKWDVFTFVLTFWQESLPFCFFVFGTERHAHWSFTDYTIRQTFPKTRKNLFMSKI